MNNETNAVPLLKRKESIFKTTEDAWASMREMDAAGHYAGYPAGNQSDNSITVTWLQVIK
jgi:hypothetical protein